MNQYTGKMRALKFHARFAFTLLPCSDLYCCEILRWCPLPARQCDPIADRIYNYTHIFRAIINGPSPPYSEWKTIYYSR